MAFKSYTKCVDRHAYKNPDFALEAVLAGLGAILANPALVTWSVLSGLEEALDYMLNKKLVCLDGDRCALGRVVGFETVEDKSFPDSVDNDFSINLMLYPSSLGDFVGKSLDEGWEQAKQELQGDLIAEQADMPEPREMEGNKRCIAYPMAPVDIVDAYAIGGFNTMIPLKEGVSVPIFHLECEGSRIHDLLKTLQDIQSLGLGGSFCKIPIIGWVICAIAKVFLAPIIAIALVIAWFAADDGNPSDARTDPEAGALGLGDLIVVTGRWTWDGGHQGWNELHPVKSIQKAGNPADYPTDPETLIRRWCERTSEAPPPDRDGPAGAPQGMTPQQQATWDAQRDPANRWVLHPAIDGCRRPEQDDEPPPVR
jgi:hypothetical protein